MVLIDPHLITHGRPSGWFCWLPWPGELGVAPGFGSPPDGDGAWVAPLSMALAALSYSRDSSHIPFVSVARTSTRLRMASSSRSPGKG